MRTATIKFRGEAIEVYYRVEHPRNSGVNYDWWFGGDDANRFQIVTTKEEENILSQISEAEAQP